MFKKKKQDNEFEKSKKEFLEYMKTNNSSGTRLHTKQVDTKPTNYDTLSVDMDDSQYAWHYELKEHRKAKHLSRFHTLGSLCGIIALIIIVALEYKEIMLKITNLIGK